jgi:hypothetical protein
MVINTSTVLVWILSLGSDVVPYPRNGSSSLYSFFFLASPTMLSGNYCMLEFEKPYSRSFEDFGLDRSFDSVGGIF